jgi:hypothetical protein
VLALDVERERRERAARLTAAGLPAAERPAVPDVPTGGPA